MSEETVPPITRNELSEISPDNCFIAISKNIGCQLQELASYRPNGKDTFIALRNLVVALVGSGRIRNQGLVIYRQPFLRTNGSGGHCLARFWLDCYWREEDTEIQFSCLLVTGSPQGNLKYTLILQGVTAQNLKESV